MKKIIKVDTYSKTTTINNISTNKSSKREKSFNIEEKINNVKNLKKLFLISPKIFEENKMNKTDNKLNIQTINRKKLKYLSSTSNKFYHSSLSSLSYTHINNERKKINYFKNNQKEKEKIIILELNKKINNEMNLRLNEEKKMNYTNNNYIKIKTPRNIEKNLVNKDINYFRYINKKYKKINNLRKIKNKNLSHISSNAISNELLNQYENYMINKDIKESEKKDDVKNNNDTNISKKINKVNNKLLYYSFNNIINDLTRNVDLVSLSSPNEYHVKLLRNTNDIENFPSMPNIQRDIEENKDDKGYVIYDYNNTNYYYNNKKKEKLFLSDDDINIKDLFSQIDSEINLSEKSIKKNISLIKDKENNDIKEDLKFLGNSNKLDWNLISEEDKLKGKETWKKLANLKKDIGINCNLNSETKNKELNLVKIIIPKIKSKLNINVKENKIIKKQFSFSPERIKIFKKEPRKTIILKPKIKLEPIKINNNPSFIRSNSIFKIGTRFIINEKKFDSVDNDIINKKKEETNSNFSYKEKLKVKIPKPKSRFSHKLDKNRIINKLKLNKRISFNIPKKVKKKKKIIKVDSDSESDLDIINEETNKDNNKDEENELDDEDNEYESESDNNNKDKINEIKNNSKQEIKGEIEENKNNINENINDEQKEEIKEEQIIEEEIDNNEEIKENEKEMSKNNEEKKEKKEEESLNEDKNEEEIENGEDIEMKEKRKKYEVEKYNKELLLKKLKGKKRKAKVIRPSIYNFLKELKNKNLSSNERKGKSVHKPYIRKYFKNIDINSLSEINKRKIELLFRIKHDFEYKIKTGEIISMDNLAFRDLELKIYSTKIKSFDQKGINEYLDELEAFFSSFENDMNIAINLKKDEDRINGFRNNLIDNVTFYRVLRGKKERILANGIDFNIVNHINELSLLEQEQENENENK